MTLTEQKVFEVLTTIVASRRSGLPSLDRSQTLTHDLGLESLDLARAVATLEFVLNADPFRHNVPITSVRTVGDLCDAYERNCGAAAAQRAQLLIEDPDSDVPLRSRSLPEHSVDRRRRARQP